MWLVVFYHYSYFSHNTCVFWLFITQRYAAEGVCITIQTSCRRSVSLGHSVGKQGRQSNPQHCGRNNRKYKLLAGFFSPLCSVFCYLFFLLCNIFLCYPVWGTRNGNTKKINKGLQFSQKFFDLSLITVCVNSERSVVSCCA